MANGYKDVTKSAPCQICGKTHWCARKITPEGDYIHFCTGGITSDGPFIGADGGTYYKVGISKKDGFEGFPFFETEEHRKKRIADYKASKDASRQNLSYEPPKRMTVLNQVVPLPNDTLDRVYRKLLSLLVLEDRHREYLHKEGWSDELIEKHHIVSFPINDYMRFKRKDDYVSKNLWFKKICQIMSETFSSLKGVPGFYTKDGVWKIKAHSGIVFPMYDVRGNTYRLRTRMDFEDYIVEKKMADGEQRYVSRNEGEYVEPLKGCYCIAEDSSREYIKSGGKYRNFSSYIDDEEMLKQGFVTNAYTDGCQAGNSLGFYMNDSDDFYCVYITEGEKKAILGNSLLKAPFISIPGVNSFSLILQKGVIDTLVEKGAKVFIIAFDADKETNENVYRFEKAAIKALHDRGLYVGLAEWDINLGKGIDDLLAAGYRPNFSTAKSE